jgi:starch phosphorylase
VSLIEENNTKQVRMAHLALVGSHCVNGVSALHTEILKRDNFSDFHALWPEKFVNITNGITQRRWLLEANPLLAQRISKTIGEAWITDLDHLRRLEPHSDDDDFKAAINQIKRTNKEVLANLISETVWTSIDPDSLFDVHVKRIHEYKRQLLKVMQIVYEYLRIIDGEKKPTVAKTYIFAGKAAPGYWVAQQMIKLIHNVGQVINQDKKVKDALKVVFLPDYRVSLAQKIIPAADLSEQISMAGTEASGTGNMKFMLNGALTVGTLDGANVEIRQEVGEENIFIFGLKAEEITAMKQKNAYHPSEYYHRFPEVRRVMDAFRDDRFCRDEPALFQWIYHRVMSNKDPYFHLPDFLPYIAVQDKIEAQYRDPALWTKKAILNMTRAGKFSSDRAVSEYSRLIWHKKQ